MTIAVGDPIPEVAIARLVGGKIEKATTGELFSSGRSVLFGVPGAFTPVCSDAHLPGFLAHAAELRSRGADRIACVAVNDAFVMRAWSRDRGVDGRVDMLADGNGELTRAMGLEVDYDDLGFGRRARRYAAVVDDGVVQMIAVEPDTDVDVSSARSVLDWLTEEKARSE